MSFQLPKAGMLACVKRPVTFHFMSPYRVTLERETSGEFYLPFSSASDPGTNYSSEGRGRTAGSGPWHDWLVLAINKSVPDGGDVVHQTN